MSREVALALGPDQQRCGALEVGESVVVVRKLAGARCEVGIARVWQGMVQQQSTARDADHGEQQRRSQPPQPTHHLRRIGCARTQLQHFASGAAMGPASAAGRSAASAALQAAPSPCADFPSANGPSCTLPGARFMLRNLTPAQMELAEYMSDLSEEAYCAGWMLDLEYALWDAAYGRRSDYGRLHITEEHRARLRRLSEACHGWIVFDDETEETWIPTAEWQRRFSLQEPQ